MATRKANNKTVAKDVDTQDTVDLKEVKSEKRKLQRDDLIPVMNYTTGLLVYESRNGRGWRFEGYGDTDEIELAELITMKNSQPRILNEPWLLILDDDAVEYLGLKNLYKNIIKPQDLEKVFSLPENKIKEIIEKVPKSVKQLVAEKAKQMVEQKKLTNVVIIQLLEELLNVDLIGK